MKLTMLFCLVVLFAVSSVRSPFPDRTDYKTECLLAHNRYRAKHHAPPLRENKEIIRYAQSRCHLISQDLSNGHAGLKKGYGENLYWAGGASINPCSGAVNNWYNEVKDYNYNSPGFGMGTGHFTQIVWKSTTDVGCARCGGRGRRWFETYIVCNYSPPGNYVRQFPQNVLRP